MDLIQRFFFVKIPNENLGARLKAVAIGQKIDLRESPDKDFFFMKTNGYRLIGEDESTLFPGGLVEEVNYTEAFDRLKGWDTQIQL